VVEKSGTHPAIRELGTLFNAGAVGMLSDGQLLDWFVERREASAFEAIVERFGPLVWGVCRRLLPDHHDAEDAFQATFLVLARRAASIMPREKLGNCLYRVAFQTSMKARATRAKRRVRERQAWELTEPEAVRDEHLDEPASGVVQPIVLPRAGRGAASRGAEDHPGRRLQYRVGQVVAPGPGRTRQRSRRADGPGARRVGVPSRSICQCVPLKDIHVGSPGRRRRRQAGRACEQRPMRQTYAGLDSSFSRAANSFEKANRLTILCNPA
jgi:RNA polymerase sigma factor (sigma-70 family)